MYFEVLWVTATGLSFRMDFLAGVLLLSEAVGKLPLETPTFETDTAEAVTALTGEDDMPLACLCSAPPTFWLLTQVNLDDFKKDVPTWQWLLRDARLPEGCFDTLGGVAGGGTVIPVAVDGLIVTLVSVLISPLGETFACTCWLLFRLAEVLALTDARASRETSTFFSGTTTCFSLAL